MKMCESCGIERNRCPFCVYNQMNPYTRFFYLNGMHVCPKGYSDCSSDPEYLKRNYPEWYRQIYGDKK